MTLEATYGAYAGPIVGDAVHVGEHVGAPVVLDVASSGPDDGEVVLLVAGLGMQRTAWTPRLLDGLHAAGYRTVAVDNRDAGRSTVVPGTVMDLPPGDDGWPVAPYRLEDLAADLVGVLDHLAVPEAHVVGMSMGGMLAQHLAFGHGQRVATLTSVMSTTGARDVGHTHDQAKWVLSTMTPTDDRDAYLDHALALAHATGSPGHVDETAVRAEAAVAWERGIHPHGTARQLLAIRGDGDRTTRLTEVAAPTLVLHGERDPLIDVSGGKATARSIAGARLEILEGMGHDLPPAFVTAAVLPRLLDHLRAHPLSSGP